MALTSQDDLRWVYDDAADFYDKMMDQEIQLPIYDQILSELAARISSVGGSILDSSCGSGHMLERMQQNHAPGRAFVGVDLSPRMVEIASRRLGTRAQVLESDMRELAEVRDNSCAAVISFLAIHHVDNSDLLLCLSTWNRVLRPGGSLLIATWEGLGEFSLGGECAPVVRLYTASEITGAVADAGFGEVDVSIHAMGDMDMDTILLWASKVAAADSMEGSKRVEECHGSE